MRELLAQAQRADFSYPEPGATRDRIPPGYRWKRECFGPGRGESVFRRAKDAIREWRMFDVGWIELYPRDAPIEAGSNVAVVARHWGFWSIHVNRIVYVIDEPRRFGFAYGTLAEHAESGEERFTVEWRDDGSVWYEVLVFSRERHVLAKIAFPLSRMLQARFRRDSGQAMPRAVREYARQGGYPPLP